MLSERTKPKTKNIYLHHKDGHRVHVSTRVSPIKDDYNKIVGAVELFDDMAMNPHCDLLYELEELKKEIYLDTLTKIGNRKFAEINLERRFSDWAQQHIPFTVFFIDIDHFKKNINDTYGHDIGDKVIKMVANSIVSLMRSLDVVCRWGGEEFIVYSPNLTPRNSGNHRQKNPSVYRTELVYHGLRTKDFCHSINRMH